MVRPGRRKDETSGLAESREQRSNELALPLPQLVDLVHGQALPAALDKLLQYGPRRQHRRFEIEACGERIAATRHHKPLYDPGRERILG